ncbi:MAG: hypothetical protein CL678_02200 [Bdellovibrionaceae bacterium]|nr:hypothetical protein [Pseudobdellovibrionaceae bacterium]
MTYFPSARMVGTLRAPEPKTQTPTAPAETPEVLTINEAAERIAFQVGHLADQEHISQPADHLIQELVTASIHIRGSAKGANQLSHFYATVMVALAEKLAEAETLKEMWFVKWRDDCTFRDPP